jgi:hypothetical protein
MVGFVVEPPLADDEVGPRILALLYHGREVLLFTGIQALVGLL